MQNDSHVFYNLYPWLHYEWTGTARKWNIVTELINIRHVADLNFFKG